MAPCLIDTFNITYLKTGKIFGHNFFDAEKIQVEKYSIFQMNIKK